MEEFEKTLPTRSLLHQAGKEAKTVPKRRSGILGKDPEEEAIRS